LTEATGQIYIKFPVTTLTWSDSLSPLPAVTWQTVPLPDAKKGLQVARKYMCQFDIIIMGNKHESEPHTENLKKGKRNIYQLVK
jgi:hypothetical protein